MAWRSCAEVLELLNVTVHADGALGPDMDESYELFLAASSRAVQLVAKARE